MPSALKLTSTDHTTGNASADIILLEYGDYQCPHCGDAYLVIKKLQEEFGPRLQYVFRHFPLTDTHIFAKPAAIAAEAAALQGRFWEMHNIMYENQSKLNSTGLVNFAQKIGLDVEQFKRDIRDEKLISLVEDSYEEGRKIGVNYTPCYFLNGQRFGGGSKDLYTMLHSASFGK
ncbi:thioredoxin domain-containing protein [Ferruginibacter sp. HRS2-29]|uniref:DsbA family protein n=1 Tax=Ferruginibacter sp. HRS2-29 TaxID=2487334 RepID=UPI0020CB7065|nr:thioredoxin domain-containing protein [Ferruginibacter sp. HRS2-29]